MMEVLLVNIIFSFGLFLIGLMFLEGIWHGKGKFIKSLRDIDNFFFPKLQDRRILKTADQLAFMICLIMAILTLLNGITSYIFHIIPNVSAIFIFVVVILSWPIRIIFVYIYRDKNYEDTPRIWPFKKQT